MCCVFRRGGDRAWIGVRQVRHLGDTHSLRGLPHVTPVPALGGWVGECEYVCVLVKVCVRVNVCVRLDRDWIEGKIQIYITGFPNSC